METLEAIISSAVCEVSAADFLHQLNELIGWNITLRGKNKRDILEPIVIHWKKTKFVKTRTKKKGCKTKMKLIASFLTRPENRLIIR